ncbi:MAG: hypothetical protein AAGD22_03610 [Verrucomicrobiota bacterium]
MTLPYQEFLSTTNQWNLVPPGAYQIVTPIVIPRVSAAEVRICTQAQPCE